MRRFPIVIVALAVAGCDTRISDAEAAVSAQLRDPDSAQFRDVRLVDQGRDGSAVCGQVNGRNGFGGYSGYEPFYVWQGTARIAPSDPEGAMDFARSYTAICVEGDAAGDLERRIRAAEARLERSDAPEG